MDGATIDQLTLNFNPTALWAINISIGLMMFGVALDLKLDDFKRIIRSPRAPGIGLAAQFFLLPALTFLLVQLLDLHPSMALGMIMVAACPGGNLSNIMTYLAKGNVAVSISMTAVSTVAAIFMTPFNLSLWGNLNSDTAAILQEVSLSPLDIFVTVFVILGIPLTAGLLVARALPKLADRVRRPFKTFSLIFFMAIIGAALAANWRNFLDYIGMVAFIVFLHNALALNLGYWSGRLVGLNQQDARATCIEVGIQNAALGLVLVFNFFDGLGGMAVVVAWWGIWHIFSGLLTAFIFTRRPLPANQGENK